MDTDVVVGIAGMATMAVGIVLWLLCAFRPQGRRTKKSQRHIDNHNTVVIIAADDVPRGLGFLGGHGGHGHRGGGGDGGFSGGDGSGG
ncbi:hypothetical protein BGZ81_006346, partial [Podila clonocystis]